MPALEARKRLLAVEVALQYPQRVATHPRVAPLSLLAARKRTPVVQRPQAAPARPGAMQR